MTKEEMRAKLKEAGKKGYMIYALCDELREESEAKDKLIEELRRKCETYESDIEKMKCCGNCEHAWQGECSLSPESKNQCLENKCYLLWELKK
jgi:hypothetical protein